ncbi:MAG: molybdenum cofactor biosynthesis protein MoaE [Desulfatiglandales bacterium]|nr:molybdenum cofactor biosynthesis protein MoaE [Desulfatiglandales bacterium]
MGDKLFEITTEPISIDEVNRRVRSPAIGAVVSFTGVVRSTNAGRKVRYLEYEAYAEMAELKLAQIAEEIKTRWSVEQVAIVHRVGRQEIGETSVVIAIASRHRQGAFEAGRYAIDRIKKIVPVWKKEHFKGGEVWIEGLDKTPSSEAAP